VCGIAGYFSFAQPCDRSSQLAEMADSIRHRGPDDEGYMFANAEDGHVENYSSFHSAASVAGRLPQLTATGVTPHHIGFAHVRYSIVDLTDGGHQPMWSACGRACLTFNGEIYNYLELREELIRLGYAFHTRSDTEVLLVGYLAWGEQVFARLNGFFAVAIYDREKRAVLLARDRLGKAHFYFVRSKNKSIYWASEIKAFLAAGCVDRSHVDSPKIADFVLFNRRDHAGTFWSEVEDFPPGHFVWLDTSDSWKPQRYWAVPASRWKTTDLSMDEAAAGLRNILCDALQIRLRADVPIAFELSGGMDSSALVGLAAGVLGRKFTTYTIEFPEDHSNEEPYARAVANRYPDNIDYQVIKQPSDHFWQEADQFVWLQEEPFHAPNLQTNQYLRRLMKQNGADVVISGAAADEMLAGYAGDYISPYLRHLLIQHDFRRFSRELKLNTEIPSSLSMMKLTLDLFLSENARGQLSKWHSGELQLVQQVMPKGKPTASSIVASGDDESSFHGRTVANMTYRRMNYWLRSGAKSDYGIPIESRAPFLDYRVVEYCCQLPPEYLINDGWHKHVLRMAVKDYLPPDVLWRRQKMGFPFPYREWLINNRVVAHRNSIGIDCPYIDTKALFAAYDAFVKVAPVTLWRLLSVMLWWRRVVEGQPILSR
jgi:asparagine synthase (glutamine-hydrolysing)